MDEIQCSGFRNFLGLSEAFSRRESSYFHVLPVPYDATSTYLPGSRMGPRAILDASAYLETYDHELDMEPARVGVATWPEIAPVVGDPLHMVEVVEERVGEILRMQRFPVVLGGEHTVGLGAVRAIAQQPDIGLVCLDAHADLRDSYQGSPYSHACFLRRASEVVECYCLGVRSISKGEADYARASGIGLVFAEELLRRGVGEIDLDAIPQHIYLSLDIDVLDPSIMPATGTPEPGGLSWYDLMGLLGRIVNGRTIHGFDVVELCPQAGNPAPDFTAAKLVYKLMGLVLELSPNQGEDRISHGKEKTDKSAARCRKGSGAEGSH
jgi:agmatinase